MTNTEWTPELAVGVKQMDDDHRLLIELMHEIHDASERHDDPAAAKVLRELVAYSDWHFAREEALMRKHRYEFIDEHVEEHRKFAEDVLDYTRQLEAGTVRPEDIAVFMQNWLLCHVAGTDRHLGQAIVNTAGRGTD